MSDSDIDLDGVLQSAWRDAPEDWLPGVAPVALVIGRSPRAVVMLIAIRAFPVGLAFTVAVRVRGRVGPFDLTAALFGDPDGEDGEVWERDRFELSFVFADGRRVSSVDSPADYSDVVVADQATLTSNGGSSSRSSGDREYWLCPLPPPGSLEIRCRCLAFDIEAMVSKVDMEPILAAASRALPIWSDSAPPG